MLSPRAKSCQLNSWLGHKPGMWAQSLVGAYKRQLLKVSLTSMFLSLTFFLPSPLSKNKYNLQKNVHPTQTSGQDGGIGRYALSSHTTKRTTTNQKTKSNQNCQKIELYGSLTTKELKKKHSSRLVGGVEMCSRGAEDAQQGSG